MVGVRQGNEEAADTPGSVGALNNLSFAINILLLPPRFQRMCSFSLSASVSFTKMKITP